MQIFYLGYKKTALFYHFRLLLKLKFTLVSMNLPTQLKAQVSNRMNRCGPMRQNRDREMNAGRCEYFNPGGGRQPFRARSRYQP